MGGSSDERYQQNKAAQKCGQNCGLSEDILWRVIKATKELNRLETYFCESFEYLNDKLFLRNALQETQDRIIDILQHMIKQALKADELFNRRMDLFESRIANIEQEKLANSIVVFGIPERKGEDIYELVVKVCAVLGLEISRNEITACYRLDKSPNHSGPPGIVIRFLRREDKDNVVFELSMLKIKELESIGEVEYSTSQKAKKCSTTSKLKNKAGKKTCNKTPLSKEESSIVIDVYHYTENTLQLTPKFVCESQPISFSFRQLPSFLNGEKSFPPQKPTSECEMEDAEELQEIQSLLNIRIQQLFSEKADLQNMWILLGLPTSPSKTKNKKKTPFACVKCGELFSGPIKLHQHFKKAHVEGRKRQQTAKNPEYRDKPESASVISNNDVVKETRKSTSTLKNLATQNLSEPENQPKLSVKSEQIDTKYHKKEKFLPDLPFAANHTVQQLSSEEISSPLLKGFPSIQEIMAIAKKKPELSSAKINENGEQIPSNDSLSTCVNAQTKLKKNFSNGKENKVPVRTKLSSEETEDIKTTIDDALAKQNKVVENLKKGPSGEILQVSLEKGCSRGPFEGSKNGYENTNIGLKDSKTIIDDALAKPKEMVGNLMKGLSEDMIQASLETLFEGSKKINEGIDVGLKDSKTKIYDVLGNPKEVVENFKKDLSEGMIQASLEPFERSMKAYENTTIGLKDAKTKIDDALGKLKEIARNMEKDLPDESSAAEPAVSEPPSEESVNPNEDTKVAVGVEQSEAQLIADDRQSDFLRQLLILKPLYDSQESNEFLIDSPVKYGARMAERQIVERGGWPAECPYMTEAEQLSLNARLLFTLILGSCNQEELIAINEFTSYLLDELILAESAVPNCFQD